jgi:hypothetical protein
MTYIELLNKLRARQEDSDFNTDIRTILMNARIEIDPELEQALLKVVDDIKSKVSGIGDLGALEIIAVIGNVV